MKTSQLHFTAVRDWRQPQTITPYGLAAMLADAARDGFDAVRMEATRFPFGYKVQFQRRPSTPDGAGRALIAGEGEDSGRNRSCGIPARRDRP